MRTPLSAVISLSVFSLFLAGLIHATPACARESTLLDSGWRFQSGYPTGASGQGMGPEEAGWDDSQWQSVSLPHCWGWDKAQQGDTNYYRGPGWYRRELNIGTPQSGHRYFLRFEAASSVADVYLNGRHLGSHRGAFGAFCYEITDYLADNGNNLLAVRVSNAPEPDIAPLSGDFPMFGGLYRPVHLIETGAENFALTDHASPGVAWLETSVSPDQAVLDVTAQISNGSHKRQPLTFTAKILDAAGNEVASTNQTVTLASACMAPYWARLVVPNPHLWNGRPDPYLYQAVVELRAGDRVIDSVEQPLGLRFYHVDPDRGFFLNGKPYSLHGVSHHQDRPDKGWAISDADMEEDVRLIQEIGATVVRCSHYEQSDYFYSLCDRAGILVWAEIPQVDQINNTPEFEETSRNQLVDLIRQNINHPSIFAWSLFNEIGNGHAHDAHDPHRELQDLNETAHGEDPTRPTIAATDTLMFPQMNKIPDLLGWNNYPGWYGAKNSLADFGQWLDDHRYTSRSGGFAMSEYGAGGNVNQHEDDPKQPKPTGQWHPEEYESLVHEADWAALKSRPFVWATFAWNMFDFTSAWRNEGGIPGRNTKGLVTYDRKTKKDVFYFYKANWSADPVLYITSRRFTERTNAVTDVKIYSNAAEVEMSLNGVSQGKRSNDGNMVFVWKGVQLSPGDNKVEATADRNDQHLTDSCVWKLK